MHAVEPVFFLRNSALPWCDPFSLAATAFRLLRAMVCAGTVAIAPASRKVRSRSHQADGSVVSSLGRP